MSTLQVQTTNDSSIISKLSSANAGYFEDPCLKMFVGKSRKRSAIINRGYYIRFKAVTMAFESWFSILSSSSIQKSQIISLGAGFDSSYFRLKHFNKLPLNCKYIEVDFMSVMERKANCIQSNMAISSDFKFTVNSDVNSSIVASSQDYIMLGIDLRNTSVLEKCFKEIQIDFKAPTLFLSECAVTYMDVKSSDNLIKWIQCHFLNSTFVAYEQVYPHDGFGIIMQNHFNTLGCPLKSLNSFPTEEVQCERYKKMGWSKCSAIIMFDFFNGFSMEEKQRIHSLELFDEYEMWHEKCHHYSLIWACQGNITVPASFNLKSSLKLENMCLSKLKWTFSQSHDLQNRFGHQVNLLSPHFLLLSGGFGHINKQHQRLGGLNLFNLETSLCSFAPLTGSRNLLNKRMFHTTTLLSNGDIVILGGRSAPKTVFENVVVLSPSAQINRKEILPSFSVSEKGLIPRTVWRHSASLVEISGSESIVIFGGCTTTDLTTNQCYILNTQSWNWLKIETQTHTPSPMHSHSATTDSENKVFITCGLSSNEVILNSVHVLHCQTQIWSTLPLSGLFPRYSHTSHYYKDHIFLIGGITSLSGFSAGVAVVNLLTHSVIELSLPEQDPEYPILLSNHCSYLYNEKIVITGGGGNCFSFGTHFNNTNVTIEIKDLF